MHDCFICILILKSEFVISDYLKWPVLIATTTEIALKHTPRSRWVTNIGRSPGSTLQHLRPNLPGNFSSGLKADEASRLQLRGQPWL